MYYLHIDCNSYFASCEVATRPELQGRAVVVANDNGNGGGVVLALNAEAKALGLKRGVPLFKVRELIERGGVAVCQADHRKYRAISAKIMATVVEQGIVQDFVQYSIDEFFGTLPISRRDEVRRYTQKVKDAIWEATAIPVGCGCSQTYTLAKVATYFAKHYPAYEGICVLPPESREKALAILPLGEVWGIGRRILPQLQKAGFTTALDLANAAESQVQQILTTAGMRTWLELRGEPAVVLKNHEQRKSIAQSRTFAEMIDTQEGLEAELVAFANHCAATLRRQHSLCHVVSVFIATNPYRTDLKQYSNNASQRMPKPTADTTLILRTVGQLLASLYRPGYRYKRAGVVLTGIVADEGHQLDLFSNESDERRTSLMNLADSLNERFGKTSIAFGVIRPQASSGADEPIEEQQPEE